MRLFFSHSPLPSRLFKFALLPVLAVGMEFVPSPVAAQATAPAPSATSAASAGPSQATPASKPAASEDSEMNSFLQAPAVQSLAKLLHLNLKTTEYLFLAINFGIIFLAVAIPLSRTMPRILRKRSMTLQHDLMAARKLQEEARSRLSAVETQLTKLDDEIQKFRGEVEEDLKKDEARIKAAIEEEKAHIVAAAELEIHAAAMHARRGLRRFAAELAVERAAGKLTLTPETDRELIAEFSASIAKDHATSAGGRSNAGGKN